MTAIDRASAQLTPMLMDAKQDDDTKTKNDSSKLMEIAKPALFAAPLTGAVLGTLERVWPMTTNGAKFYGVEDCDGPFSCVSSAFQTDRLASVLTGKHRGEACYQFFGKGSTVQALNDVNQLITKQCSLLLPLSVPFIGSIVDTVAEGKKGDSVLDYAAGFKDQLLKRAQAMTAGDWASLATLGAIAYAIPASRGAWVAPVESMLGVTLGNPSGHLMNKLAVAGLFGKLASNEQKVAGNLAKKVTAAAMLTWALFDLLPPIATAATCHTPAEVVIGVGMGALALGSAYVVKHAVDTYGKSIYNTARKAFA